MHRAQKASSKLCHDREVEKAQVIHKRKIDGVKSYLTAITRPPAPTVPASSKTSKPSTFFRRSLRQHVSAPKDHQAASHSDCEAKPGFTDDHIGNNSDEDGIGGTGNDEGSDDGNSSENDEVVTESFGKLDELRSVLVPVMTYKGHKSDRTELDYERYLGAITNPPPSPHEPPKPEPIHQSTHSLRASAFRMRRLKQIENDNQTIFERIKNSTAHYRTDSLKKDWDQNVAYLTSICAFPVVEEALHAPARRTTYARKRSPFAPRLPDQLPSLQLDSPLVVHPIKAIPTSPKKANTLNLSPAFRSLRKGLPQVPALPPLNASPRPMNGTNAKSMTAAAASRSTVQLEEPTKARSSSMTRSPSPPARTESAEAVAGDLSRYTLLKIGRFVGGKYLILTVFYGDGITNPYGFDVVAMDPETQVEFHLSVSKETTHLLLETTSSSTMAERTAAAAGTNLSMELIARCICDHIRYAQTGASEVVFLVATVGNPGGLSNDAGSGSDEEQLHRSSHLSGSDNASLLLDTMYSAMAFCLHQYVQLSPSAIDEGQNVVCAHVFARTRPQQCCQASMRKEAPHSTTPELPAQSTSGVYKGLVCFEVCEEREEQRYRIAQLLVSVSEVIKRFEDEYIALDSTTPKRLSLDRFLMLSLQFLHLRPAGGKNEIQLVLTPSHPNEWMSLLQPPAHSPCRPSSTMLPRNPDARSQPHVFTSRQIVTNDLPHQHKSPSHVSAFDEIKNVLQTGMLWRGVYLFARIVLVCPGSFDETSGQISRKPSDELLVFNVLNTSTGNYSERVLHGDHVDALSEKLGAWQSTVGDIPSLVVFAKLLLLRMRLDVDLRGQEIILFPTLEPRYHNAGGRSSSPEAASRRNSPVKQVSASAEGAKERDHTAAYSLDAELQQQTKAARSIQKLARRYLRRRRHGSSTNGSALDESLPSMILAFMRNRAAKRIQFVSRSFAGKSAAWRRQAYDVNGVQISMPRALTPTAATTSRIGSNAAPQLIPNAPGFDGVAAGVPPPLAAPIPVVEADETDDEAGDGDERSQHMGTLGILQEDEQEEDQDGDEGSVPTKRTAVSQDDRAMESTLRWGNKVNDRFVLGRQSAERTPCVPSGTQELRIIGALGQLSRPADTGL